MGANLLRCDFCDQDSWCVGVDGTHRYFECSGSSVRHEWSELRNPSCARCGDPLTEHVALSAEQRLLFLCPRAIAHTTFVWPEDAR